MFPKKQKNGYQRFFSKFLILLIVRVGYFIIQKIAIIPFSAMIT